MDFPAPPRDNETRNIIDKLAQFVARNGPEFEMMTKSKQENNPKFAFLYGGEYYNYYQYKVAAEQAILKQQQSQPGGVGQQWSAPPSTGSVVGGTAQQPPSQGTGGVPPNLQQWIAANIPPNNPAIPGVAASGNNNPAASVAVNAGAVAASVGSNSAPPTSAAAALNVEHIVAQQNALREQIRQSEQNLNAQHGVLLRQQQSQIEQIVIEIQSKHVERTAERCGIQISEMDGVLQPIIDSCTKDNISSGKSWILQHASTSQHAAAISQYLLEKVIHPEASFNQKLHIIYLVNDVLHHCARKNAEDLKKCLESVVVPMYCNAHNMGDLSEEQQGKLDKLLRLWEAKSNYFDSTLVGKLKSPVQSYREHLANLIQLHAAELTPYTQQTRSTFEGYQQQHQAFVGHAMQQIQSLESQIIEMQQNQKNTIVSTQQQQQSINPNTPSTPNTIKPLMQLNLTPPLGLVASTVGNSHNNNPSGTSNILHDSNSFNAQNLDSSSANSGIMFQGAVNNTIFENQSTGQNQFITGQKQNIMFPSAAAVSGGLNAGNNSASNQKQSFISGRLFDDCNNKPGVVGMMSGNVVVGNRSFSESDIEAMQQGMNPPAPTNIAGNSGGPNSGTISTSSQQQPMTFTQPPPLFPPPSTATPSAGNAPSSATPSKSLQTPLINPNTLTNNSNNNSTVVPATVPVLPDLSKPPPGFAPLPPRGAGVVVPGMMPGCMPPHMMQGHSVVPPLMMNNLPPPPLIPPQHHMLQQQSQQPLDTLAEDLTPTIPYFDLPAGLMVPLIKLEDHSFTPLDPWSIRLPPPVPPNERLLNAVEAFYTPYSHDRPRDSEGWEKLALYEYYKAKNAARKDRMMNQQDDMFGGYSDNGNVRVRERSGSISPILREFNVSTSPPKRRYRSKSRSVSPKSARSQSPTSSQSRSPSPTNANNTSNMSSNTISPRAQSNNSSRGHMLNQHSSRRQQHGGSNSSSRSNKSSGGNRSRYNDKDMDSGRQDFIGGGDMSPDGRGDRDSRSGRGMTPPSFGMTPFSRSNTEQIDESNKGHQMLKRMGWGGTGLGTAGQGIEAPISGGHVRDRQDLYKGIGVNLNDPYENFRKNKGAAFITRMKARAEERS